LRLRSGRNLLRGDETAAADLAGAEIAEPIWREPTWWEPRPRELRQ